MTYSYYMLNRPPSFATHPTDGLSWIAAPDTSSRVRNHGVLTYDRQLTDSEASRFDLFPVWLAAVGEKVGYSDERPDGIRMGKMTLRDFQDAYSRAGDRDSAIRNSDGAVVAYQYGKWQIRFEEVGNDPAV